MDASESLASLPEARSAEVPRGTTLLLAAAVGVIVANCYYAQPLVGPISAATGLDRQAAGLIVTLTQLGYGAGLLFIVPLADLVENRRLVLTGLGFTTLALLGAAFSHRAGAFLAASLAIGLGSVAVQVLVPYAAHLAPEASRGRVVGQVMSGLFLGIMLARPLASALADLWGWHAVYFFSAGLMLLTMAALGLALPPRRPEIRVRYAALLGSMWSLFKETPVLRRRAFYHAFMFGAFSVFWTASPLYLAGPAFHMAQRGIALFALAGVAGAVVSPLAGRMADQGLTRPATILAMLLASAGFLVSRLGQPGTRLSLGLLVLSALLVDAGVSASLVLSQRAIFSLGAESRGRLNAVFMALFFVGGGAGSALGSWAFAHGGWPTAAWVGFAMPFAALLCFLALERRRG